VTITAAPGVASRSSVVGSSVNITWPSPGRVLTPELAVAGPNDEPPKRRSAVQRVVGLTSAVLGVHRAIEARLVASSLVMTSGAGTGTRTPGLLITSNLEVSAVLTNAIVHGTRIAPERKPPSYQLSSRAARRPRGSPLAN